MFIIWLVGASGLVAKDATSSPEENSEVLFAQTQADVMPQGEDEIKQASQNAEKEDEQKIALKNEEKKLNKERKKMEAQRDALPTVTEYTLDPGSVEAVIELDPKNYGFRQRNYRMALAMDFDLIFRGRAMLSYDFRFFEYVSFALKAGIDWTSLSLYSRFRDHLTVPAPQQFSVIGGIAARFRLTEWYLHSAVFLEPSLMTGYMWQTLVEQDTGHFRIRPGLFAAVDTVFDSGLSMSAKVGFEIPFDFGEPNLIKEVAEPLVLFGLGLAI